MNVLKDWYDGYIFPAENIIPKDPEYHALGNKIGVEKDYFAGRLSQEDCTRFQQLYELVLKESNIYAYANFVYGFKLGMLLMQEVVADGGEMD